MNSGQLQTDGLTAILNQHFQWDKTRMDCCVGMSVALMGVGTANLAQLALSLPCLAQTPSRYRLLQRFFSEHWIDCHDIAHFIMKLFGFTDYSFERSVCSLNLLTLYL
jgi:hypothetical protein